jgi:N-acetyl sugar amidotransferase
MSNEILNTMNAKEIKGIRWYDEEKLKADRVMNNDRPYQQCSISVMDTIADPGIHFDAEGVCNYYHEYKEAEKEQVFKGAAGVQKLNEAVAKIKEGGKGKEYDCILGLSGGADSSYLAYLAKQHGLRPLVVHFDYGWNLELAVQNIENIIKQLDFNLYTIVMDWEEMKSLQRSYYRSSVLDLDVPADHMIFGALYETADKFGIKYILSGKNIVTEAVLPSAWNYNKFDLTNLRDIHRKFENGSLKKLPALGVWQFGKYTAIKRIQTVELLNFVDYNKAAVKKLLREQLNWRDYGGKHYENIFTRFYQSYLLPVKFGIDKRKAHLSNLIFSNQITKAEALQELSQPPYEVSLLMNDLEYVSKKLGFTMQEFVDLINQPNKRHDDYATDIGERKFYWQIIKWISPATRLLRNMKIRN